MSIDKQASAHWSGGIKDGKGTISTQSGALREQPYGFNTRFESEPGTNPEELIAAAHSGCFAMAMSKGLQDAGFTAEALDAKSVVSLEQDGDGFTITRSHLTLQATVPGIDVSQFNDIANTVKQQCPVSKVLNAEITLEAKLNQ